MGRESWSVTFNFLKMFFLKGLVYVGDNVVSITVEKSSRLVSRAGAVRNARRVIDFYQVFKLQTTLGSSHSFHLPP
jgi:hypothetical protein